MEEWEARWEREMRADSQQHQVSLEVLYHEFSGASEQSPEHLTSHNEPQGSGTDW